jgi:hypothetical protein
MRGMWRRSYGRAHRAPLTKRGGNSDALTYGHRATSLLHVRRGKALSPSGCEPRPAPVAPAGSNRSNRGGDEAIEAFGVEGPSRDLAIMQAVTRVNVEQASKEMMRKPTRRHYGEG